MEKRKITCGETKCSLEKMNSFENEINNSIGASHNELSVPFRKMQSTTESRGNTRRKRSSGPKRKKPKKSNKKTGTQRKKVSKKPKAKGKGRFKKTKIKKKRNDG